MLAADTAAQISGVAVAWQVYAIAHRPLDLGLVGLVLFLPALLLVPLTGFVADRVDRRRIVVVASAVEIGACAAFVPLAARHGTTALAGDLAVVVVLGVARAFAFPAEHSLLPTVVTAERYPRAQATASAIRQLLVVGGPALGGILIGASAAAAYGTAALLFALGAAGLGTVRLVAPRRHDDDVPSLRDAFAGLHFLRERPVLAGAISLDLVAVFFGGATALLPAYAVNVFHVGAAGFGALRASVAVGAGLTAATIARRPLRTPPGATLLATVAVFGLATIVFGVSTTLWLAIPALVVIGGADMVSVVVRSSLVQLGTPDAMRGRVSAVEGVAIVASNELGEFESGTLASLIGLVPAVVAGGAIVLVTVALWGWRVPALRRAQTGG